MIQSKTITNYPMDWDELPLGNLYYKIRNGFVGTATPYYVQEEEGGVKYLQGKDVKNGKILSGDLIYVQEDFHQKQSKSQLKINDLVMVQSGHVGECAVITKEFEDSNCHALIVLTPNEKVDSNFYSYLFNSNIGKRLIYKIKTGNTVEHILASDMKVLKVPVPTYNEQKKISSILSIWDKAIELKQKLIEHKKEQKTGLIETLLSGKKRIKGFNEKWKHVKLKEIAHINKESLSSNTSSNYEFYYYDISSVENGNVAIQKDLIKFLDAPSRARRVFRNNDILMSTVRPNLKGFAFIDFEVNDAICSTGFAVISAEEVATNKFIYYNLFSTGIETQIEKLIVGSNYPAINASEVGNLKIYYPLDPKERQRIIDIIYCADKELKLLQLELKFLKEQKKALMQQLLTGKIRVKV